MSEISEDPTTPTTENPDSTTVATGTEVKNKKKPGRPPRDGVAPISASMNIRIQRDAHHRINVYSGSSGVIIPEQPDGTYNLVNPATLTIFENGTGMDKNTAIFNAMLLIGISAV